MKISKFLMLSLIASTIVTNLVQAPPAPAQSKQLTISLSKKTMQSVSITVTATYAANQNIIGSVALSSKIKSGTVTIPAQRESSVVNNPCPTPPPGSHMAQCETGESITRTMIPVSSVEIKVPTSQYMYNMYSIAYDDLQSTNTLTVNIKNNAAVVKLNGKIITRSSSGNNAPTKTQAPPISSPMQKLQNEVQSLKSQIQQAQQNNINLAIKLSHTHIQQGPARQRNLVDLLIKKAVPNWYSNPQSLKAAINELKKLLTNESAIGNNLTQEIKSIIDAPAPFIAE